ncbi:uncharacterized protein LOC107043681 [Diachasma alloeum]|uniref:uncharacterized protein LOC107043681 n=1 Tax=Diachasma alloeum TaxID=454923 RepID=UPI00073829F1|nr:uncharacterized protein LOC107043681 [Diachasma alloeum]
MKVLQLNLNHCETAHYLCMQMVRELKLDLTIVSEPYCHLDTGSCVTDASKKAAIWNCGNRPFQSTMSDSIQKGFVWGKVDGIYFYSCYAPPSLATDEFTDFLDRLTQDAKQQFSGDFNTWAVDWGSKETNTRGQGILEAMSALDVVLMNSSDEPTCKRGEASSIVRITFVSNTLETGNCSWRVADVYTASDHRAILWQACTCQRVTMTPKKTNCIGWRVSSFDPSSYSIVLDDRPISGSNATEKADNIIKRLTEACEATMSRKRTTNLHPPVYWWNYTIAVLWKQCNAARRLSQRSRKKLDFEELEMQYKEARRKFSKAIKSYCYKKQSWSNPGVSSLMRWKVMHGGDPIHAIADLFLDIYSKCLRKGIFPAMWKQQRIVLLPKWNKLPDDPSSYRPLCMIDTAGKILERIVHQRIEAAVESLLAENQYGFLKGCSTLVAINIVVNTARDAISGKRWLNGTKTYCLVITLDIKNAFNSAKWNRILEALSKFNVPGYLQKIVGSYFTGRVLKYDKECGSKEYRVIGGILQGSVLGPLLWNTMHDGLLKLGLPRETKLVAFADDLAAVIVGKYLEEINYSFDTIFETMHC